MNTNADPMGALRRAVDLLGSQASLARAINLSGPSPKAVVWAWFDRGRIPAEHCPAIERATGGAVRCEDLRPDVDWQVLRGTAQSVA